MARRSSREPSLASAEVQSANANAGAHGPSSESLSDFQRAVTLCLEQLANAGVAILTADAAVNRLIAVLANRMPRLETVSVSREYIPGPLPEVHPGVVVDLGGALRTERGSGVEPLVKDFLDVFEAQGLTLAQARLAAEDLSRQLDKQVRRFREEAAQRPLSDFRGRGGDHA